MQVVIAEISMFAGTVHIVCLLLATSVGNIGCQAFSVPPQNLGESRLQSENDLTTCLAHRREFLSFVGLALPLVFDPIRASADEDLSQALFNQDGSLKEGVEAEAKERIVGFSWDVSDNLLQSIDGKSVGDTKAGSGVRLAYKTPMKWSDGSGQDELYFDRSEGINVKACKRITVYQASGVAGLENLQKAATVGVAKSLRVPDSLAELVKGDIISGKVAKRTGPQGVEQTYYEFDMATAPETCGMSNENLGLGFCPYDHLYLISATILKDRLYACVVECDSSKIWKLASSDLKRVRSSFSVEEA